MPRRRGRRGRGAARSTNRVDSDWVGGVNHSGEQTTISSGHITVLSQKDRPYKIQAIHYEVAACDVGTTINSALFQVDIFSPVNKSPGEAYGAVATSGPKIVSIGQVLKGTLRNPGATWFPTGAAYPLFRVANIAQSAADKTTVRWTVRIDLQLRPEEFMLVKPAQLCVQPD